MSKTNSWFGTQADVVLIASWLRDAGAHRLNGTALGNDLPIDGKQIILHFPAIGPIEFWPEHIPTPEIGDNSPRAKLQFLAISAQQDKPTVPLIDVDRSPVAMWKLPAFRDNCYWVSGELSFPTSRLKDVFPELNRIASRFERFMKKHPVVYDNTNGPNQSSFAKQICESGILHKIYALPEAFALLNKGACMIDRLASDGNFAYFQYRLQRSNGEM